MREPICNYLKLLQRLRKHGQQQRGAHDDATHRDQRHAGVAERLTATPAARAAPLQQQLGDGVRLGCFPDAAAVAAVASAASAGRHGAASWCHQWPLEAVLVRVLRKHVCVR